MKTKQNMRRLVALTLTTAVTLPQTSPIFAASEIGRNSQIRLEQLKLSTEAVKKSSLTTKDRFPLLSLPKTFQHEINEVTVVPKIGMETSVSRTTKLDGDPQNEIEEPPKIVTTSYNKLQQVTDMTDLVVGMLDPVTGIENLVTGVDDKNASILPTEEGPPGTGELLAASPPESGDGETTVDNRKTVGAEGITDVTTTVPDEGKDPLSGGVVMPLEAASERLGIDEETGEGGSPAREELAPDNTLPVEGAETPPASEGVLPSDAASAIDPESLATQALLGDLGRTAYTSERIYDYVIGYGLEIHEAMKRYADQPLALVEYGDRFQVELSRETDPEEDSEKRNSYGYWAYSGGGWYGVANGVFYDYYGESYECEDGYDLTWVDDSGVLRSYAILPTEERQGKVTELGRVPDKTFDGWYVYPQGVKDTVPPRVAMNWIYGDNDSYPITVYPYGEGDPDYDYITYPGDDDYHRGTPTVDEEGFGYNRDLGATWDEAQDYAAYGYGNKQTVALVGRWRPSDESRAADVTKIKEQKIDWGEWDASGYTRYPSVEYTDIDSAVTLTAGSKKLELYTGDIVGKFGQALRDLETSFDRGSEPGQGTEYWLRVPADVDSLDLEFNAAEIFYEYNKLENKSGVVSPVKITWSYAGEEIDYTANYGEEEMDDHTGIVTRRGFTSQMLPNQFIDAQWHPIPVNSPDNSAYSRWMVTNIALKHSTVGAAGEGYLYNDVTITVYPPSVYEKMLAKEPLTAEDEAKATTYTFHIQRLTEPTLSQAPGNTPMGMILRDTSVALDKAKAEAIFRENYQFSHVYGEYPRSEVNNGGSIFRDRYTTNAWNSAGSQKVTNVDLDPEAIVVYQNSAFKDPGVTLTDAEGRSVKISVDNDWVVYRKLKLKTAEELTVANLTKGRDCWYAGWNRKDQEDNVLPPLRDVPIGEVLRTATDQIDLRGLKVLPGIYEMEYELYDPVADKTYSRDTTRGDWVTETGIAGAINFVRTVVVLPLPGDVDMDGAVTSADAETLREYLKDARVESGVPLPPTLDDIRLGTNATVDLFAYRVANMDHDDTLDKRPQNSSKTTDVDLLEELPQPQLNNIAKNGSDYYYLPLPSDVEAPQRKTLTTNPEAEGPKLELVYLGNEGSRIFDNDHVEGYFANPNGPWKNGGKKITTNISENDPNRMTLFDTMWVGVKLTGADKDELLSGKSVDTFTFSLVYDGRYLEPASVLSQTQWEGLKVAGLDVTDPEVLWRNTLSLYNMGGSSMTVWGTNHAYTFTRALQSGRAFMTYDTKAITPLETAASAEGRYTHLRELVFSITLNTQNNNATPITMDKEGDQWLLAVPFTMIQHPLGIEENRGYKGVEMQAGMSDFTLIFQDGKKLETAAYNPLVEDIFGGNTKNLATHVTYANTGPEVPLGKDKSQVLYIRNEPVPGSTDGVGEIVYSDDSFRAQYGWNKNSDGTWAEEIVPIPTSAIVRYAPEWLHYERVSGVISGRPTAAGTYNFTIANYRYELVVEQAPLHYWAESQSSYYGETGFRGEKNAGFTFRYDPKDIRSIEQERAVDKGIKVSDGLGADLEALLDDGKYLAPEFTAVDSYGVATSRGTRASASAYAIISTEAQSSNYDLIYTPTPGVGLTILPRPLQVEYLTATNVGRIFSDEAGTLYNREATLSNTTGGKEEFHVSLPTPLTSDPEGHYNGRPLGGHTDYKEDVLLPGDSLTLRYNAELLKNERDESLSGTGNNYYLEALTETRIASVSGLMIVGGVNSDCYTLGFQGSPIDNNRPDVVGTVRRRNIIRFNIEGVPPLEYAAGDQLGDSTALRFYIEKESDGAAVREGIYPYNELTTFAEHGVRVSWASAEDMAAGRPGSEEFWYHDGQILTTDFDGRYLCLSTDNGMDDQGNPKTIVTYYDKPLRVAPRSLVLTAVESSRFYGEKNGELKFTYDPTGLSVGDLAKLREKYGNDAASKGPRDGAELAELLSASEYRAPTLSVIDRVSKDPDTGAAVKGGAVSERSNAGVSTYVVLIEGAWCKNYTVQYSYTYIDEGTRKTDIQGGWGASSYTVRRRPIVVDALRDTEATKNLATLYADTKRIFRADLPLSMDDVVIGLPTHDTETTTYYPRYGAASMTTLRMGYAPESSPILEGDALSLEYRATMASQDGQDYVHWTSFSKGHFNMDSAVDGSRRYPVQVWYLTLKGSSSGNYELVYRDNTSATLGAPARWEAVTGCIAPGENAGTIYYAPIIVEEESDGTLTRVGRGEGTVTLRPIEKIEIISTGMLNYTYGDTYTPNQPEANQRQGLRIHIEYLREDTEDSLAGNVTTGEVDFRITGYTDTANGRVPVTTFDERGLRIYYQPGKGTTDTDNCQELEYLTPLSCDTHDGKYLVVAGKRGSQTEMIWSAPSEQSLSVQPRTLTLRVSDAHRAYGEENPTSFPATFDVRQLAAQDQAKIGATSGSRDVSLLNTLGLTYKAPVFGTVAVKKSPVKNRGLEGYAIDLRAEGSLTNYKLEYELGTLYIYPRRVQIAGFNKDPIYTIYSDMGENIVHDVLNETEFTLQIPAGDYRPTEAPNGVVCPMTGSALVAGDEMDLRVEVSYPTDWRAHRGSESLDVTVSNAELLMGMAGYGNYEIAMVGNTAAIPENARQAKGKVQLRQISSIRIQQAPFKTEYEYGETLDLTGLVVNISYQTDGGTTAENLSIPYQYYDQFKAQGLYVNYYPVPEIRQVDNSGPEAWARIRGKYYTAFTGDHVTIAPTHGSMEKPQGSAMYRFAANGQYLVVTAQRESEFGEGHIPAAPVLVRSEKTQELVRIKVNPRPLQFDLEANDKIYDATTNATGTLGFANVFRQMGQVDRDNRDVTDMVYPVTGADREDTWGSLLTTTGNQDFSAYISENGYRFSTGDEGYQYGEKGTMTFSFLDPNVAYDTEPTEHDVYGPLTTKVVQVKELRLGGADAANYVLRTTEVTEENAAGLSDYLNSGKALPRATIHKADREPMSLDILPTVEVDPNTNVVRVNYDQSTANIVGGENEKYLDELHFEYALQYVEELPPAPETPDEPEGQAEETTLVVEQLAGRVGELLWWDETYHGGETVSLVYPEGYIPKEEDIPQPSEGDEDVLIKGQVYAWAEEDGRFTIDEEAYPGGEIWPEYDLYRTDRAPLARNRVYWPVVRVAETHNYNASPAISSVREYTPAMIQEVLDARAALWNAGDDEEMLAAARERAAQAAEAAIAAMGEADAAARLAAQEESRQLTEIAESGKWPEEWIERAPAAAVKTYAQRLELVSIAEMEGRALPAPPSEDPEEPANQARAAGNGEKYQVPTLEAVWFTDIQEYGDKKLMDAVVRSMSPVRYQDYAWDSKKNVPLFQDKETLSLAEPFPVTIFEEDEEGNEIPVEVLVNQDNSARIYVELRRNSSGLIPVKSIEITSGDLIVELGADPVRLRVKFDPVNTSIRTLRWESSDESVARVDSNGLVTFVGEGIAVITATSLEGASDSITVTVRSEEETEEPEPSRFPGSIFNIEMREQFLWIEEGTALFHPEWAMTRGEAAQLLIRFYVANPNWTRTGPADFQDLTGEESYAAAARLLGSQGVFLGLPGGRFGGEQNISRAEFVVLLIRMMGIEVPDTTGAPSHAFRDTGEEDTWAYREIDAAKEISGFTLGSGEGYFSPRRAITRAESAVFLTRLLQFPLAGEDPVIPRDVGESYWARNSIIRAVNQGEPLEELRETEDR